MSRNGSGVYSLPAGNPVVTGTTISSSWANTTLSDIATALTGSVAADGQTAMTGNLQMGNNKVTGLAVATASGDALSYGQAATISALTVSGAFAANGGATLGDASGDALTINSSAVSIPNGLNFDSNTFVVDATNNRVGVGTGAPAVILETNVASGNNEFRQSVGGTSRGQFISSATDQIIANGGTGSQQFWTGGSERMRIDSSGNVGIGTNSPVAKLQAQGSVNSGVSYSIYTDNSSVTGTTLAGIGFSNAGSLKSSITAAVYNNDFMAFNVGGSGTTERMRIDSSGNVGIGTSSPNIYGSNYKVLEVKGSVGGIIQASSGSVINEITGDSAGSLGFVGTRSNHPVVFKTNDTERMRIDSAGSLAIGLTDTDSTVKLRVLNTAGQAFSFNGSTGCGRFTNDDLNHYSVTFTSKAGTSALHYQLGFFNSVGSTVGSITHNNTNTTYGTSSDYRLKENIAPMTGALGVVGRLKPCTYTWKANGSNGQGFIAHELQEVVPDAVVGEKDAVNEDGSIKPQGIDTSYLVATLTAAIQEQQAQLTDMSLTLANANAIITDLKSRLEVLEAK